MPTIDLPLAGPVERKYVIAGGVIVAGAVGVAYVRRYQQLEDGAEPVEETVEVEGELPYVTPGPGGLFEPGDQERRGFATNADWGTAARQYLIDSGVDPEAAAIAVGRYLDRQQLDSVQQNWVRAAIGGVGPPPAGTYTIIPTAAPPAATALPAPTGFSHEGGQGSITFKWAHVTGATGYDVELIAGQSTRIKGPQTVSGGSVTFTGLSREPGTSYRLAIWARNNAGQRGTRGTYVGRTGSAPAAARITTAPKAFRSAPSRTGVTVAWQAVPGAKAYGVELIAGVNTRLPQSRIVPAPRFDAQGLTPNRQYRVRVVPIDQANRPASNHAANHRFRTDR